jgi:hypothetical protein
MYAIGAKPVHLFALSSALAAGQLAMHILGDTKETLDNDKRRPFDWGSPGEIVNNNFFPHR